MNLIMADALYHVRAHPHHPIFPSMMTRYPPANRRALRKAKRCKLSVVAEATAQFHRPLAPTALRPYDDHFWPPSYNARCRCRVAQAGPPMVAAAFVPLPTRSACARVVSCRVV